MKFKSKIKKVKRAINKSPINYFSDLFIVAMVGWWIVEIIVQTLVAIYATIFIKDVSMWTNLVELVTVPLTAGGAIWMIKCAVQHAISNKKGKECKYDFPDIDESEDIINDSETDEP